ncbi:cell wall-binding repeat-containing protein [Clostridium sp. PL3]|uniref:Cell wall-binding repeat-containing protein n=1 Tax=Clostridium thailandense TaxID=2794346 RepID=A0A949X2H6_9CLOT|nr:cell wall-binding repeat-containing protein [Clostridium thailandense]MBV7271383.1 cell wall-binding repeat-containing protein [Clostridium thailandense]
MKRNKYILSVLLTTIIAGGIASNAKAAGMSENRIFGQDRYQTSINASKAFLGEEKPKNIIIAYGENYPDALSAGLLAKKLNAPIILVSNIDSEDKGTYDYLKSVHSDNAKVTIIGGTGVVSSDTENKIKDIGYSIDRIQGADRYETNRKVIENCEIVEGTPVVITSGEGFADALSANNIVSKLGYPVFMTSKDSLDQESLEYIKEIKPSKIIVVGGPGVVSDGVIQTLSQQISSVKEDKFINLDRWFGLDRYQTSSVVLENLYHSEYSPQKDLIVASGENFPDALVSSPLQNKLNAPLILSENNGGSSYEVTGFNINPTSINIFGGTGVLSDNSIAQLKSDISKNMDMDEAAKKFTYDIANKIYNLKDSVYNGDYSVIENLLDKNSSNYNDSITALNNFKDMISQSNTVQDTYQKSVSINVLENDSSGNIMEAKYQNDYIIDSKSVRVIYTFLVNENNLTNVQISKLEFIRN